MNAEDIVIGVVILLISVGLAGAVAAVDLPGTSSTNTPVSGEPSEPRYDLSSSVTLSATTAGEVNLDGFTYTTTETQAFFSIASVGDLAIGGANAVKVSKELRDSSGALVASEVENIGEIGARDSVQSEFNADNLRPGIYTVSYEASFSPELFGSGDQTKTLEKRVEVPKQ